MKRHAIHFVTSVAVIVPYTLQLRFEDGITQTINFEPLLHGQIYGPLRDPKIFSQVRIDSEIRTIVWPNGADFDPATLHDWPEHAPALIELAKTWALCPA
jgi:hypothetical protein